MARSSTTRAVHLNMVATPHPSGIYLKIAQQMHGIQVKYWGDRWAAVSEPEKVSDEENLWRFQLYTWTEINPIEPTIKKAELKKSAFPKSGENFIKEFGVNGKIFICVLDTKKHVITVEILNDLNQSIGPSQVEKIFRYLSQNLKVDDQVYDIEVTLKPRENALEEVLGIKRITKINILLKRPNPDDVSAKTGQAMKRLKNMNAKQEKLELIKAAKTTSLKLDDEHKDYAEVASENGYVEATGKNSDGDRTTRSTREMPKISEREIPVGSSNQTAIVNIARDQRDSSDA